MTCTGAISSTGNGDDGTIGTKAGSCTGEIDSLECCDEQVGEPDVPDVDEIVFLFDPDWPGFSGGMWSMSFGSESGGDSEDDSTEDGGGGPGGGEGDDGGGDGPNQHPGNASGTSGGGVVVH